VNMCQRTLPEGMAGRVVEWEIPDPIGMSYQEHCQVRDEIERKVAGLIDELRREQQAPHFRGQGSGRVPL